MREKKMPASNTYLARIRNEHFVSAIMPVKNEEKTVANVLRAVARSPLVDEIVVVNDGSTDNSLKVITNTIRSDSYVRQKTRLINLAKNIGKTRAVIAGLKRARGDIIFLCDADLIGFRPENATSIIKPVLEKKARMSLGVKSGAVFKSLVGERAVPREDLVRAITLYPHNGWALETNLNRYFKDYNLPVVKQKLPNVHYKHIVTKKGLIPVITELGEIWWYQSPAFKVGTVLLAIATIGGIIYLIRRKK